MADINCGLCAAAVRTDALAVLQSRCGEFFCLRFAFIHAVSQHSWPLLSFQRRGGALTAEQIYSRFEAGIKHLDLRVIKF